MNMTVYIYLYLVSYLLSSYKIYINLLISPCSMGKSNYFYGKFTMKRFSPTQTPGPERQVRHPARKSLEGNGGRPGKRTPT
jgi:hypothetical protein